MDFLKDLIKKLSLTESHLVLAVILFGRFMSAKTINPKTCFFTVFTVAVGLSRKLQEDTREVGTPKEANSNKIGKFGCFSLGSYLELEIDFCVEINNELYVSVKEYNFYS